MKLSCEENGATIMKKEEVKNLIREYLSVWKEQEVLREELRELEERYETLGDLLYGYRSKSFIHSALHCLAEMSGEYEKDHHYIDFIASLATILKNFDEFDSDRRNYTPQDLQHLYDDKVE